VGVVVLTTTEGRRVEMKDAWTIAELRSELLRFEAEPRATGKAARTIHTYVDRAERFLRWLVGDYDPRDR
jgi:hypothetical protein